MTTPHPPSASAAAEKPAWKVRWLDYQTGEERAEFCHSESAAREYPHSGSTILSVTEYRPLSSWQRAQSAPQDKDALLTVIREWKFRWMAEKDNGYRERAFGIDANMMHDLASALSAAQSAPPAPIPSCCPRCRASLALSCEHCKLPFPPKQPPQEVPVLLSDDEIDAIVAEARALPLYSASSFAERAQAIVSLIGNFGHRPDVTAVQDEQVRLIVTFAQQVAAETRAEMSGVLRETVTALEWFEPKFHSERCDALKPAFRGVHPACSCRYYRVREVIEKAQRSLVSQSPEKEGRQ
jgi:hypothetical protein